VRAAYRDQLILPDLFILTSTYIVQIMKLFFITNSTPSCSFLFRRQAYCPQQFHFTPRTKYFTPFHRVRSPENTTRRQTSKVTSRRILSIARQNCAPRIALG